MSRKDLTFPRMYDVIPEGQAGCARVEHFDVSEDESRLSSMRGGRSYVPAGRYARLCLGAEIVMSDTAYERRTNYEIVRRAEGRVLIAGLGLGMVLTVVLKKHEVDRVVVVEKHPEVVALVADNIRRYVGRAAAAKLTIIEANIFCGKPQVRTHAPFDCMWFDIWGSVSTDTLGEMTQLSRMYGPLRRDGAASWLGHWDRGWLRYRRGQERRAGW